MNLLTKLCLTGFSLAPQWQNIQSLTMVRDIVVIVTDRGVYQAQDEYGMGDFTFCKVADL